MMKKLFTLLLTAACFTASAQVEFPWNPDSNGDGEIGVDDLLGMLASFGESWELPSANQWASTTLQGLLSLENELDSLGQVLQSEQFFLDSLAASLDSVNVLAFCSEQLTSWNSLRNDCFIQMYDGAYSNHAYHVPDDCFHVTVSIYYGCNCCSYSLPIRLPQQGMYVGQIIDFTLLRQGGCINGSISIEALVNGSWSEASTLFDATDNNTSQFNTNFFLNPSNKRFIWDGFEWILESFPTFQVEPSQSSE